MVAHMFLGVFTRQGAVGMIYVFYRFLGDGLVYVSALLACFMFSIVSWTTNLCVRLVKNGVLSHYIGGRARHVVSNSNGWGL